MKGSAWHCTALHLHLHLHLHLSVLTFFEQNNLSTSSLSEFGLRLLLVNSGAVIKERDGRVRSYGKKQWNLRHVS